MIHSHGLNKKREKGKKRIHVKRDDKNCISAKK